MKWLRISAMLIAVLAVMRVSSWIEAWSIAKFMPIGTRWVALVAIAAAFGVFVLLLIRDLLPGEPLGMAALGFGLAVFAV
jgi:hypothetical protein